MLKQAAGLIGHRAIRNRGTAVGSVAQSDPTQEIPTVMAALGGKVVLRDGLTHGDHIYDFFDYLQLKSRDQLKPYHYIREIRLPKISPGEGDAFQEFAPRQNDPPIVSVAVRLTANSSGKIVELEGAVAGLKPVPVRFKHENLFFSVQDENKACFEELTQLVMGTVLQADGPEASSHFNRNLVKALLVTSLKEAYHQAQANEKEGA
jgi:CO/xanthine dehydrogenase FAD-binding subunit